MNVEAVVLSLLLKSNNRDEVLTAFNELKAEFFSPAYLSIFSAINKYFNHPPEGKANSVPTMEQLKLRTREKHLETSLEAINNLEVAPEIDFSLAISVLKDQFTQKKYLEIVSTSLDDISSKSSEEIMESAAGIVVELEKHVKPKNYVHTARDITIVKSREEALEAVMHTGISNKFDSEYGATRRGELFLIGGRRGAGKSVICINIAKKSAAELKQVVPYFSIEMSALETMQRYVGICSGVEALKIRNQEYTREDIWKMAKFRATMFSNGEEILQKATKLDDIEDFVLLEKQFTTQGIELEDSGLIIIDDPTLKLSSIDMYLSSLKTRYGSKLGVVVVDYINQIVVDGADEASMYDWKNQIVIAKGLKALARKHEVVIFAPYQIDETGEARMAKGILDSCDFAFKVEAVHAEEGNNGALKWTGVKARSLPAIDFSVPIDWGTLSISATDLSEGQVAALKTESNSEEDKAKSAKASKKEEKREALSNKVLSEMELT